MASTTPNIGLTLPTGTEGWKRSVINGNFKILDTKIGAVGNTPLQTQINTLSSQIVKLSNITEAIKSYGGGGTTIENTSYLLGELSISNKSGLLFYYASGTANLTANDVMVFRLYDGDTLLGGFGSTNLQGKQWISTSGHYKLTQANHTMRLVLTTFSGETTINVPAYNSIVGRLMFIPLPA